ncbi:MAG: class I SAM-dependent methyltransferase [Betaproteobacteria bacterium]
MSLDADGLAPLRYALEPGAVYTVDTPPGHPVIERWQPPAHLGLLRPALVLLAGESLHLRPLALRTDSRLRLSFAPALPSISSDGLTLEVLAHTHGTALPLFATTVAAAEAGAMPRQALLSLPPGLEQVTLELRCGPGPRHDPSADWLALIELTIAPEQDLDLVAARAFRSLRLHYERAHFNQAFDHPMYVARRQRVALGIDAFIPSERSFAVPGAVENAFDYALARLCQRLSHKAPDFEQRLRQRAARGDGRPLRLLSIGTGLGLTEAALLHQVEHPVELTVVDVNDQLLAAVASIMPPWVRLDLVMADVNDLTLPGDEYDLALCVSGVHHVIELGAFFARVRDALAADGELWLIGENIGPSGNRLDEDALAAGNRLFVALPERLRRNAWTGQVDAALLNPDRSEATFEGIRSHEIEREVARFFTAAHVSRRNCILWRWVGPEYVGNFDLTDAQDRSLLDRMVEAELDYRLAGGQPTELHGVYTPLRRQ